VNGFTSISRVTIPGQLLQRSYCHFRERGDLGCEGVALWVGRQHDAQFDITELVIPEQTGVRSDDGLAYVVKAEALHRLNVWLHQSDLRLVAQVHSHPTEAYHSDMDDSFPIMTTEGGFSIVVPDFGRGLPALTNCAVYRLSNHGWNELSTSETVAIFNVI